MRKVTRQFFQLGQTVVSVLLTAVVLLLLAMAASEPLHKLFHEDAGTAGHACAVTLFAHGQVDAATVEISCALPAAAIEATSPFLISVFRPAIENLPAGRAPPVFVSSPA